MQTGTYEFYTYIWFAEPLGICYGGILQETKLFVQQFTDFTFMLPCIVKYFCLNNQPDAIIIPILFSYKILHVSGIFPAYHQEFSTVHSALVSSMQVSDDRMQAESGWNRSSILTLLGSGHQKPAWNLPMPNVQ